MKGNGQIYEVRLRSTELNRPWQSYKASLDTTEAWTTVHLPFETFEAHRTDVPFSPRLLRRVGILGIDREFRADVSVRNIALYR